MTKLEIFLIDKKKKSPILNTPAELKQRAEDIIVELVDKVA